MNIKLYEEINENCKAIEDVYYLCEKDLTVDDMDVVIDDLNRLFKQNPEYVEHLETVVNANPKTTWAKIIRQLRKIGTSPKFIKTLTRLAGAVMIVTGLTFAVTLGPWILISIIIVILSSYNYKLRKIDKRRFTKQLDYLRAKHLGKGKIKGKKFAKDVTRIRGRYGI